MAEAGTLLLAGGPFPESTCWAFFCLIDSPSVFGLSFFSSHHLFHLVLPCAAWEPGDVARAVLPPCIVALKRAGLYIVR